MIHQNYEEHHVLVYRGSWGEEFPIEEASEKVYNSVHNDIADKYCKGVRYQTGEKIYDALGFKDNSGGYELRIEYFKVSKSPKNLTLIENKPKNMAVFEGFFNFIFYLTLYYKREENYSRLFFKFGLLF